QRTLTHHRPAHPGRRGRRSSLPPMKDSLTPGLLVAVNDAHGRVPDQTFGSINQELAPTNTKEKHVH
ncbi:hypothetical protein, partial [Arthrobacter sp. efr-133-R2A-120]|uniref:hypothetical protein n=1 Tax=Arthrobacter sp. efr-133-R2A-120 TaxID=3040277 RepID=UPI00254C13DA